MKNSQMFAINGVSVLGAQMHGWPAILLGLIFFVGALLWLERGE